MLRGINLQALWGNGSFFGRGGRSVHAQGYHFPLKQAVPACNGKGIAPRKRGGHSVHAQGHRFASPKGKGTVLRKGGGEGRSLHAQGHPFASPNKGKGTVLRKGKREGALYMLRGTALQAPLERKRGRSREKKVAWGGKGNPLRMSSHVCSPGKLQLPACSALPPPPPPPL